MTKFLLLAVALLTAASAVYGETVPTKDGELLAVSSGRIKVEMRVRADLMGKNCVAAQSWRWGVENGCPDTYIGSMAVSLNGSRLFIPYSAFADLGNPRTMEVSPGKSVGAFQLEIHGGDAGTSYNVILKFDKGHLSEKIVRHGEFPDEAWELTKYGFNF